MISYTFLKSIQPYAIGIAFVLVYIAENIFPQRAEHKNLNHDLKNIGIGFINAFITFIGGYYFQKIIVYLNNHQIGLFHLLKLPFLFQVVIQLIIIDIFMYGWHRLNHTWQVLWRFHKFHHADKKMNSTTALRFHVVELSLSFIAKLLIFPLLGISITAIVLYSFLFLPVVIIHHSNIRIAEQADLLLRKIIVTPRMHRIHHSRIMEETNSNYSSVFPWWDTLFKTYRKKAVKEIEFGLEE